MQWVHIFMNCWIKCSIYIQMICIGWTRQSFTSLGKKDQISVFAHLYCIIFEYVLLNILDYKSIGNVFFHTKANGSLFWTGTDQRLSDISDDIIFMSVTVKYRQTQMSFFPWRGGMQRPVYSTGVDDRKNIQTLKHSTMYVTQGTTNVNTSSQGPGQVSGTQPVV